MRTRNRLGRFRLDLTVGRWWLYTSPSIGRRRVWLLRRLPADEAAAWRADKGRKRRRTTERKVLIAPKD